MRKPQQYLSGIIRTLSLGSISLHFPWSFLTYIKMIIPGGLAVNNKFLLIEPVLSLVFHSVPNEFCLPDSECCRGNYHGNRAGWDERASPLMYASPQRFHFTIFLVIFFCLPILQSRYGKKRTRNSAAVEPWRNVSARGRKKGFSTLETNFFWQLVKLNVSE